MPVVPDRFTGLLAYRDALKHKDATDPYGSDACVFSIGHARSAAGRRDALEAPTADAAYKEAGVEHAEWRVARDAKVGDEVVHGGVVVAEISGMGKVYDWTTSSWTPVSGGRIKPLLYVDHIPVIHNAPGIADFIRLRDVLVAQGLMVQNATDRSGNVALFTPMNSLCYQARGANSFSAGCEHMHYSTGEQWSSRQLNAASYVHWRARHFHGIANRRGRMAPGNGVVRVVSRGYTTHKEVSAKAGYNDRSDPGSLFEAQYDRIERGVRYFEKHRSFKGF